MCSRNRTKLSNIPMARIFLCPYAVLWSTAACRRFHARGSPRAPATEHTHDPPPTIVTARGQAPATKSGGKPPHSRGCAFSTQARGFSAFGVNTPWKLATPLAPRKATVFPLDTAQTFHV